MARCAEARAGGPGSSLHHQGALPLAQHTRPRGWRRRYFPREVFFLGFGLTGSGFPSATARAFCFFVATRPPIAVAATVLPRRPACTPAAGSVQPCAACPSAPRRIAGQTL